MSNPQVNASAPAESPSQQQCAHNRWLGCKFASGLILGIVLGIIIGVRFLYWSPFAHSFIGFVPPYPKNPNGYVKTQEIRQEISPGMTKQQVIEHLNLEQVVVLSGGMSDETWRWVSDGHATRPAPNQMSEAWLIPWGKTRITSFTAICFNEQQKVSYIGSSEFMFGFPTNTFDYARKGRSD